MPIRIPWDDYEIALMFEVYKKMEDGLPLNAAAQQLSIILRSKATKQGIVIDDVFRNTNGMVFYLKRTEYLFTDGKSGLSGAQKNVIKMFELYQHNPFAYQQILNEATHFLPASSSNVLHQDNALLSQYLIDTDTQDEGKDDQSMNDCSVLDDCFYEWVSSRVSAGQLSAFRKAQALLDEFCIPRRILVKPVFMVIDVPTLNKAMASLESNRIFKMQSQSRDMLSFLRYYIRYLKENHDSIDELINSKSTVADVAVKDETEPSDNTSEATDCVVSSDDGDETVLREFKHWLKEQGLSSREVYQYWRAIKNTDDYLHENKLYVPFITGNAAEVQMAADILTQRHDFSGYGVDYYREAFSYFVAFASSEDKKQNTEELNASIEEPASLSVTDPLYAFNEWLHNDTSLSETSMRRYRWAIHVIDEYIKQNDLCLPLVYADAEIAKATAEALFRRQDFAEKNAKQHNRLSAALGQYLRFLGGDGSISRESFKDSTEPHTASENESDALYTFVKWMEKEANLSERSVTRYRWAIGVIDRFIQEHNLSLHLINADGDTIRDTAKHLLALPEFAEKNARQHNRFSAALGQYAKYADCCSNEIPVTQAKSASPMLYTQNDLLNKTIPARSIDEQQKLFRTWLENNGMATSSARVYTYGVGESGRFAVEHGISSVELYSIGNEAEASDYIASLMADVAFAEKNRARNNQLRAGMRKYIEFLKENPTGSMTAIKPSKPNAEKKPADPHWKEILEKDFPDGYILNDFLSQFQASAMWQERYGEPCPLEGDAIDQAISACGTVKDGHVFISSEDEGKLLAEIADLVADTLTTYSNVYADQVYQRYHDALAQLSIFTEKVMTQQILQYAAGRFYYAYSYLYMKPGDTSVIELDCERALRKHGGMMTIDQAADELWFIPRDKVGHYLSTNSEILNLGAGLWMLAEHFPFSQEDANQVAKMLDECFLSQEYILSRDIPDLLSHHLPFIAENVSSLSFTGLFNIIYYYLHDRFSFSRSIVAPAGSRIDFTMLFRAFGSERESFTVDDLDAYAKELNVPIYWESTYAGGAVRITQDAFINRNQIRFDIHAIDHALETICSGDYMSFASVPDGMMVLLPTCGYQWNQYLLQSYVYGFSKVFKMVYNSLGKGGCYGAIVRRDCKTIDSYEKLVEQVLTDDNTWATQTEALNLLVKQGYQAQRRLNGIENIIAKAKQNKMK